MRYFLPALTRDQWLLFINNLLWGFGGSLYLYIQPIYLTELKATPEQIGIALGLSVLVVTLGYVPLGMWTDNLGRKPLMVIGWAVAAGCTGIMALAPDWRWFAVAYAVYHLTNFVFPAFQSYIIASATPCTQQYVISTLYGAFWLGSIFAPVIGGWIGEHFGLRAVYATAAGLFGLATLTFIPLRDQPHERTPATHHLKQLWRNRAFVGLMCFIFLLFFILNLGQALLPKYLEEVRGFSLGQIGQMGTAAIAGVTLFTWLFGRMKTEGNRALVLSQVMMLAALALFWLTSNVWLAALAYFIGGGHWLMRPLLVGRLAHTLEPAQMHLGLSFYQTVTQAAVALSPYIAGLLYERAPTWPLYAGMAGIVLTLSFTVLQRTRSAPQTRLEIEIQ